MLNIKTVFLLGAICVVQASAQSISVGVIGGAPFTDVVNQVNDFNNTSYFSKSSNFTVGPSFQINLPLSLRFEVDALYRPYSFSAVPTSGSATTTSYTASASEWRFPFLLQYRFHTPLVKPFVEAGVSFNHLAQISAAANNFGSITQSNAGFVVGGGADVKIPFIRLSGELRYTHQSAASFDGLSNLYQAEVLFGVHF